jgi:Protein of unknown function (DUF3455)
MTRLTRLCRAVGVGLAVATATLSMTQVAGAAPAPPVPKELVPTGAVAFLTSHAKGVQIYKCSENPATKAIAWTFVKPQATLKADNGQVIDHSQGPTWTAADGSTVTGSAPIKVPADTDPNFNPATAKDIQQLLLKATPGKVPGILDATTFIQRLNTQGGTQPPVAECKVQTLGKEKEVPCQADYVFFKAAKPA